MGSGVRCVGSDLSGIVEHRHVDAGDGLHIHVASSGTGEPLVFLHGFTGSTESWVDIRSLLDSDFRFIAIDAPGHGRSSSPADPRRYSLDRFAHDLCQVFDALDLEQSVLYGYSFGGRAALRFALAYPERLSALILESASPGIAEEDLRQARQRADDRLADSIDRNGVDKFVEHWESLPLWESQKRVAAERRQQLHAQRMQNNSLGLSNSLRGAGAGVDECVQDRLREIRVPTLLIAGELDPAYVSRAETMQESMPNAAVLIVDDAGHAVHFENPEAIATAVKEFLLDSHE